MYISLFYLNTDEAWASDKGYVQVLKKAIVKMWVQKKMNVIGWSASSDNDVPNLGFVVCIK